MAAADYYNTDPRYRPSVPQYPPPRYEPRSSRRPDHGLSRMEAHEDSPIEEIPRKFPPGEYADGHHPKRRSRRHRDYDPSGPPPRRARSARGRYDDGHYGDRRSKRSDRHGPDRHAPDRHRPPKYDEPRRDRRSRRSPSSSASSSPPPPRRKPKRRKSLTQQAMGAMGALGIGNSLTGAKDANPRRHRSDSRGAGRRRRNRSSSSSSSRSRSRDGRVSGGHAGHGMDQQQIAQAVKAALTAGAAEAYRARKEPGGWTGAKGKRIITAAIASGGADGVMDNNPNKHGKRHVVESALAGLATNHALNGPRSRGGSRDGKGHSSKSGAVKGIATSGALLAAGKEIYDHLQSSRSKSRGRDRSSSSSSDGRDPRDRRRGGEKKKRSKSLSDYVSQGLAAVGLNDDHDDKHHEKPRRHGRGERERSSRYDDPYDSDSEPYDSEAGFRPKRRGHGGSDGNPRDVGRFLQEPPGAQNPNTALSKYERRGTVAPYHPPPYHSPHTDNDSDLGSSSEDENKRKKMVRHQMLTTGMATIATVHAAHSVVGSMKKRKERLSAVREGDLDPKDARNQRRKNMAKDAASVGLAALSVHGVVDEWKEAKNKRAECLKFKEDAKQKSSMRASMRSKSVDAGDLRRWREGTYDSR